MSGGLIVGIERGLGRTRARRYLDVRGKVVMPGAIDAHTHIGIYRPLAEDAATESASALIGGVSTILSYFRTGSNYLNMTGPYRDVLPRMLDTCKDSFITDYSFHVAPMLHEHVAEIDFLLRRFGISTFKYYTFYKTMNLAASGSSHEYLQADDVYDGGHLYRIMERVAELSRRRGRSIRLSVHCEDPEIIRIFLQQTKARGKRGLAAYSAARPPLAEVAAIKNVALLAQETGCPVNFLHLSSEDAIEAASSARTTMSRLDATMEVTLHHLMLNNSRGNEVFGKVNPPIRTKRDNEALWKAVESGEVDIVASDHACHMSDAKGENVWEADPGFGGTALLMPLMVSEAYFKRSLPLTRVADLICRNPATYHGVSPREGVIAPGSDADLVVLDMAKEQVMTPAALHSAQDFTPFQGLKVKGWPTHVTVRGLMALDDGEVVAKPGHGQYIRRPVSRLE